MIVSLQCILDTVGRELNVSQEKVIGSFNLFHIYNG